MGNLVVVLAAANSHFWPEEKSADPRGLIKLTGSSFKIVDAKESSAGLSCSLLQDAYRRPNRSAHTPLLWLQTPGTFGPVNPILNTTRLHEPVLKEISTVFLMPTLTWEVMRKSNPDIQQFMEQHGFGQDYSNWNHSTSKDSDIVTTTNKGYMIRQEVFDNGVKDWYGYYKAGLRRISRPRGPVLWQSRLWSAKEVTTSAMQAFTGSPCTAVGGGRHQSLDYSLCIYISTSRQFLAI
ncbi:beta-hexosaminidase subunit beta isoform X1 [Lates japonicus]|uniref:Beta-hexosaminidase subunit beta isoform X1 n=1 Tax=Lates japonicus TaxID=270547 RepID=A0AAD3N8P2_LATJO|nr:beta-hexosaminidase subunit beta isoform X1 [Lates japonicus]